ncbi:acyl-CoA dehydrogenase family protein [Nocardia sp. NPDC051321]|uniref:acyl-CoA dehydrogenase family protein n=1 Tax=Nocardia sp. NPDC051321 TaxID=3364323 RepID=UPI0037943850
MSPLTESAGEIPNDLFDALRAAGCFRMLVPARYGGAELELPEALRVIQALARADGAVGWVVGVLAATPLILCRLDETAFDSLYSDGPDVVAAGAVAPKGAVTRQDDGWRVSGRWPFVSGCRHTRWIYLHCVEFAAGAPRTTADNYPVLRMVVIPRDRVRILDTWHTLGLRGTGSHDVRVAGAYCPDEFTGRLFGAPPTIAGSGSFTIPLNDQIGLFISTTALGIAAGVINEIAELAIRTPSAASAIFHDGLGAAQMTLAGAEALLYDQAAAAWQAAERGAPGTALHRTTLRATPPMVMSMAAAAVDHAYQLTHYLTEHSPRLHRQLRDLHTATQHAAGNRDYFGAVGTSALGYETEALKI